MCDTIQELDEKNDRAHEELKSKLNKGLRTLEDSLTSRHIKLSKKVDDAVEKLDIAAREVKAASTSVQAAATSTQASANTTVLYKALFSLALLALLSLGGLTLRSFVKAEQLKVEQLKATQQNNKTLDSIKEAIRESYKLTKMLDTKTLMDTMNVHWQKEINFYDNEFVPLFEWTHKVLKEKIEPAYIQSKKNDIHLRLLETQKNINDVTNKRNLFNKAR